MDRKKQKFRSVCEVAFGELRNGGAFESLRRDYLSLILTHNLENTAHIRKISDWVFYPFFCAILAQRLPSRRSRIVDWGGWYGQVTAILGKMGYKDVSNYLLEVPPAYEEFAGKFDISTIYGHEPNHLEVESDSVDVLISSGVLEHVGEDGKGDEDLIVEEIKRVLKPGAWFFVWNLPAMLGTSEILALLTRKWRHERRFWFKEALGLLERHGFRVETAGKHKFLPGSLTNLLAKRGDVVSLTKWDHWLSQHLPFSIFARDYFVLAQKPGLPS